MLLSLEAISCHMPYDTSSVLVGIGQLLGAHLLCLKSDLLLLRSKDIMS